jgi:hypothetical protein
MKTRADIGPHGQDRHLLQARRSLLKVDGRMLPRAVQGRRGGIAFVFTFGSYMHAQAHRVLEVDTAAMMPNRAPYLRGRDPSIEDLLGLRHLVDDLWVAVHVNGFLPQHPPPNFSFLNW